MTIACNFNNPDISSISCSLVGIKPKGVIYVSNKTNCVVYIVGLSASIQFINTRNEIVQVFNDSLWIYT